MYGEFVPLLAHQFVDDFDLPMTDHHLEVQHLGIQKAVCCGVIRLRRVAFFSLGNENDAIGAQVQTKFATIVSFFSVEQGVESSETVQELFEEELLFPFEPLTSY